MARTVPVAATETPGLYQTSALWNAQVRDLNNFALAVPVFSGYSAATQSIPGGNAMTSLAIDTTLLDSDAGHSNVTNNSRYTPTVAGTYLVIGSVGWAASSAGDRRIQIAVNGTAVIGSGNSFDPSQIVTSGQQTAATVTCNGTTDYIEVMAAQSSGGALSTSAGGVFSPAMRVIWISR